MAAPDNNQPDDSDDQGFSIGGLFKKLFSSPVKTIIGLVVSAVVLLLGALTGHFSDALSFSKSMLGFGNDGTAPGQVGENAGNHTRESLAHFRRGEFGQGFSSAGKAGKDVVVGLPQQAYAVHHLESLGWSKEQASGMVANLMSESGGTLNTGAFGDSGSAYGIVQWHGDRLHALEAAGFKVKGGSLTQQLDAMNYELTQGGEREAGRRLRQARTAKEAGEITSRYYERPLNTITEADARGNNAERLLSSIEQQDGVHPLPTPSNPTAMSHPYSVSG